MDVGYRNCQPERQLIHSKMYCKGMLYNEQDGGSECAIVQLGYAYLPQLIWFMKSHGFDVHEF